MMSKQTAALAVLALGVVFVLARSAKPAGPLVQTVKQSEAMDTINPPDVFTLPSEWTA